MESTHTNGKSRRSDECDETVRSFGLNSLQKSTPTEGCCWRIRGGHTSLTRRQERQGGKNSSKCFAPNTRFYGGGVRLFVNSSTASFQSPGNFFEKSDRTSPYSSPNINKPAFLSTTNRRVSNQGKPIKTSVISFPANTGIVIS